MPGQADWRIEPQRNPLPCSGRPHKTVRDRNFLVALRLYGTGVEFFDQSWKPDDVVKVK